MSHSGNKGISRRDLGIWKFVFHILAWSMIILMVGSSTIDLEWGPFERARGPIWVPVTYGTLLGATLFYLNVLWLIPGFFGRTKKWHYWLLALAWLIVISAFEAGVDILYIASFEAEAATQRFNLLSRSSQGVFFFELFLIGITGNLFCWILAFAYRLPQDWLKSERQKRVLEHQKLKSELNFLKAQINPHFLFNGINSIYHMIDANNHRARDTLHQFSGLLRYQLYECNEKFISLNKELNYINNYLAIEKVRKGEDATIKAVMPDVMLEGETKRLRIAPLLITPFLENGFKFLSNYSDPRRNIFDLKLTVVKKGTLSMKLMNSYEPAHLTDVKASGIGLENVKRRLAILYPDGRHDLNFDKGSRTFTVDLTIELDEN